MKRMLTYRGRTQSLYKWSVELGIDYATITARLDRFGYTLEEALTTPPRAMQPRAGPPKPIKPPPKLARHASGRAWCRWSEDGRRRQQFFGRHGSAQAKSTYARFCSDWWANLGRPAPPTGETLSVAGLALRYLEWAETYFRKAGKPTSEVGATRAVLSAANELYGDTPAAEFSTGCLRGLQAKWESSGLKLRTVNHYCARVVRIFSWGVERGLVPTATADALKHVRGLVAGRSAAPVSTPVRAADGDAIAKVLPRLHEDPERCRLFGSMLRVQLLTGMRPGELCELRAEEIDRTRETWLYVPGSGGKTLHLDKPRRIWIGPQARTELQPWIDASEPGQPLFRYASRRTLKREMVPVSGKVYRSALQDTCELTGAKRFTPNQLRHAKANAVQRVYEDDKAVAAALGNSPEVARQVYVDNPADAVAKRIAESLG